MSVKKILSLAVVLAMAAAVIPTFGLVASAAETTVLFETPAATDGDYAGNGDANGGLGAFGWSGPAGANFNINFNNGVWGSRSVDNTPSLMFFRTGGRNGSDENVYATLNNAEKSEEATNISIEFTFASQDLTSKSSDDKPANDQCNNYQTWEFKDFEGNTFAQFFVDIGTDGTGSATSVNNAEIKLGASAADGNVHNGYIARSTTSRQQVLDFRGKTVKIDVAKQDDGKFKVTYTLDGKEALTETKDKVNGFGGINEKNGGWSDQYAAMGLQGLKITASGMPTTSYYGSVRRALNALEIAEQSHGEKIVLPTTATDEFGTKLDVTWTSDNESVVKADGTVTVTDKVEVANLTPSATLNGETTSGSPKKIVVFPASRAGQEYPTEYVIYSIDSENMISNGSFEDADGNFSGKDWKTDKDVEFQGPADSNYWYAVSRDKAETQGRTVNDKYTIPDGNYALGTRWNDGTDGNCTFNTAWTVTAGNKYYFSFYVKSDPETVGTKGIYAYFADKQTSKAVPTGDQVYQITTNTEWKKYEYVFDAKTNGVVGFYAYNLGVPNNNGNGPRPFHQFDNFELYEATVKEAAADTTVNYKVAGKDEPVKTVTQKVWPNNKAEFDAIELYYEGTVYSAEAQTLNSGEIKDVTMTAITDRTYVTADIYVEGGKVKNPDSANKVMAAAVGNDTSGLTGPGTDADGKTVTDGIHSPSTLGGARVGLMSFPLVDVKDGQQVIAVLPVDHYHDNGYANGNTTLRYSAYALSDDNWTTLAADAELDVMSLKRLSENAMFSGETPRSATEVRFDVTDAVKAAKAAGMKTLDLSLHTAWGGVYYCQLEDIADTARAAYLTVADGQTITIAGDTPAKVTKNGSVVSAPVVAQAGDVIRAYDANGGKMLLDGAFDYTVSATDTVNAKAIVTPEIEAKLGWNGEKFTIDYVAGDVTPVDGAEYAVKVNDGKADLEGGAYNPAEDAGVGFAPNDTNRIYSATSTVTVNGVVFKAEKAVDAGIYGLVMDAVANSELTGQINAKQLEVVNEVLKNGNILLTAGEDGTLKLTDAAAKVMTLDGNTITLTDKAVQLGLKFTSDIGAGKDAATAPTKVGSVSEDGKSVTLPEGVTAAEVVAFSLDSVYLEFVPTEITEGEADAGADFGLVPEL